MSILPPSRLPEIEIPPLENGDRLSRAEFERRYNAMSDVKKAELVEGVVHMPSPARFRRHGNPHLRFIGWLAAYEAATPGVLGGDNSTIRLDLANEPQPDALLLIEPHCGGQARISDDDYVESAPELAAEIAASRVGIDLGAKKAAYLRNGVREYLVWRVRDPGLDWFVLSETEYAPLEASADGVLRSEVFPGLWLDPQALVAGDLARVHEILRQGLATPEHAAFVARLAAAGPRP